MTTRYPASETDPSGQNVETDNADLDNAVSVRLPQASDPCQASVINAPAKELRDRLALVEANLIWNAAGPAGRTQSAEAARIGDNVTTAEMSITPNAIATKLTYSYQDGCGWFYAGVLGHYAVSCETDCDFPHALMNGSVIYSINASGQATFQGLTCNGATSLKGTTVDGTLTVAGNSSLKNTSVTGNVSVSGRVTAGVFSGGDLQIISNNDVTIQTTSGLSVSTYDNIALNTSHGVVEIGGTTQITGNLDVSIGANVEGSVIANGNMRAANIQANGTITAGKGVGSLTLVTGSSTVDDMYLYDGTGSLLATGSNNTATYLKNNNINVMFVGGAPQSIAVPTAAANFLYITSTKSKSIIKNTIETCTAANAIYVGILANYTMPV